MSEELLTTAIAGSIQSHEVVQLKVKCYQNLIGLHTRLMASPNDKHIRNQINQQFPDLARDLMLFASNDVLKAWNSFRVGASDDNVPVLDLFGDVIVAIRQDLGSEPVDNKQLLLSTFLKF